MASLFASHSTTRSVTTLHRRHRRLIFAAGYKYTVPTFLTCLKDHLRWTPQAYYNLNENYSIDKTANSCFVQNADLYSHGFNSADLGLGAYQNAVILNTILGEQRFKIEHDTTFQSFDPC